MSFASFIAKRIYTDSEGGKKFSRPAVRIAMMGIAIGLAVMIVSLSVVLGFKKEVSSKVIGFGSHIQVVSLTQTQDYELMPVLTTDSLYKEIRKFKGLGHIQKFASKLGIIKTEDDFGGVTFKGIGEDYDTTFLSNNIVEGRLPEFSSKKSSNSIVISRQIAQSLGLSLGDRVYSYFIDSNSGMRARKFTIQGIYETNLTEYDKVNVFTDIYTVRKLNRWTEDMSSGYEITVKDFDHVLETAALMHNAIYGKTDRFGVTYGAFSIKELAPHTFSWLAVLDVNVIMILVLMLCVSGFTIVSGLLIIMLERINMISVLKSLGATNMGIRKIFVHYAIMLIGKGILIGDVVGIMVCLVQKYYPIVKLDPTVYYLDSVPVCFDWLQILGLNLLTLAISSLVIFGSSFFISINKPAKTMRFE